MNRREVVFMVAATVAVSLVGPAYADLIGVQPGFPVLACHNQGTLNYDSGLDVLSIDAIPTAIRFSEAQPPTFVTPPTTVTIRVLVDETGALIGGVSGDDLIVTGETVDPQGNVLKSPLLLGEVLEFGYLDSGGPTDEFDFRFEVTGGSLAGFYVGKDIGVTLMSESSDFTEDFAVNFSGGAKGIIGPIDQACLLDVEKKGCVIIPPPPPDRDCDKPIDELTMIWDGSVAVRVIAWKGSVGSTQLVDIDDIQVGDEVSIAGFAGSPNDVYWEVFNAGTADKIGESTFHLSCSDQDMNGPEDCGLYQGNGKKSDPELINDWIFEGFVDVNGAIDCTPNGGGEPPECITEIPPGDGPSCPEGKELYSLQVVYSGADCSATMHGQDPNRVSCEDLGLLDEPVRIVARDKDHRIWLDTGEPAGVLIGDAVDIVAANGGETKLKADTFVEIYDDGGELVQAIKFHTSCSQPLVIGNRFGSIEVVAMDTKEAGNGNGSVEVEYTYTITNIGVITVHDVSVIDDVYGEIPGSPIVEMLPGEEVVLSLIVDVSEAVTNIVTVTSADPVCQAVAEAMITKGKFPPCTIETAESVKLDKKKLEWELTNTGDRRATIESIEISWPDANGKLKKVKLHKDIFKQELDPPSATITTFTGKLSERQLKPGERRKLAFEFEHDVLKNPGEYTIVVNFVEQCSVEFDGQGILFFECRKPIDVLTMIWDGDEAIRILAWKGAPGTVLLADIDGIDIGDEVTVSGYAGSPNDVTWEILQAGNNNKLGESMFHLSCSDRDMNGPEDCGANQGDGKKNDPELINDWILEGMVDSQSTLDCSQ